MCNNPFCSCCHRAYMEGIADGYQLGYVRGHRAGYVTGYVDAARCVDPQPAYRAEITSRLEDQWRKDELARAISRLPGSKPCGCFGACTCDD